MLLRLFTRPGWKLYWMTKNFKKKYTEIHNLYGSRGAKDIEDEITEILERIYDESLHGLLEVPRLDPNSLPLTKRRF